MFLKIANVLAKYSCPRWNRRRILRRLCRMGYRGMAGITAWLQRNGLIQPAIYFERAGVASVPQQRTNTYPALYRNPKFAPWEEDDSPEGYNLISDPAGFVIRRSTSYCAWKIYELTGRWPKVHSVEQIDRRKYLEISLAIDDIPAEEQRPAGVRFDARYWREFLALNGYTKVVDAPVPGHHYIGIQPKEGEFGQVVWTDSVQPGCIIVSTYRDFEYQACHYTGEEKTTWVEIC